MTEAFENWWREHFSMANLAMGAASDAWDAATEAERERCAKIAANHYDLRHGDRARFAGANIAAAIRTSSAGEETYG